MNPKKYSALLLTAALIIQLTRTAFASEPVYENYISQSEYVAMPDGIHLAVDYALPEGLPVGERVPAILIQTRYWRALHVLHPSFSERDFDEQHAFKSFFCARGYAVIVVDVRGTGASFGTQPHPWAPPEVADMSNLVDWVTAQPWSSGSVGGYGISYDGVTAYLLAGIGHPAVRACAPWFTEFDLFTDNPFPGGVFNEHFVQAWSDATVQLDQGVLPCGDDPDTCALLALLIDGPKRVDADPDGVLLALALADHTNNLPIYDVAQGIAFRDEVSTLAGVTVDSFSPHQYRAAVERSGVPLLAAASWLDGATAQAALSSQATTTNRQFVVIGPWNHGADQHTSPYWPVDTEVTPSVEAQWEQLYAFFEHHLRDAAVPWEQAPVTYYTLGEEVWKTAANWPPAPDTTATLYFAANHGLSEMPPGVEVTSDTYAVDFSVGSGTSNRWHTQLGGSDVDYGNRSAADTKLLVYDSESLAEDLEITGFPVVHIYLNTTHTDGFCIVYLEDVAPDGTVRHVTEGELRFLHRQVATQAPPVVVFGPYHSFLAADALPVEAGATLELPVTLYPVSVLLRAGHRIRIALAGADADQFPRTPESGDPVWQVQRHAAAPSRVELPVIARPTTAEAVLMPVSDGGRPVLVWNAGAVGYSVSRSDTLGESGAWNRLVDAPMLQDGLLVFEPDVDGTSAFYRLERTQEVLP